jgi:glycosyltransferase 2 family protein
LKAFVKRLIGSRLLKWAVVVIAIAIGAYEIAKEWHEVHQALGQIGLLACLWALLALLVMQFATLRAWLVLLAGLGSPLPHVAAGRILFIGQLGKYIPGSVWPILAQMELGARANVPRTRSASASVLTMLLSLFTGLLVAMVTLPFVRHDSHYLWVFLAIPLVVVVLQPRVLNPLLNKLFKLAKRPPLDRPLTGRVLVHSIAWSLTAWIFNGLQIWFLAEKFGAPAGKTALLALGGYAFAWCVGFLVVIAPAGAGIRDTLIVAALAPVIGSGPALAVALVSRAVNTVSDLLVAGAAAASRRRGGDPAGGSGGKGATVLPDETGLPEGTVLPDETVRPAERITPVSSASEGGPLG